MAKRNVSVYRNDVIYLYEKIKKRIGKIDKLKNYEVHEAMIIYINDELDKLRKTNKVIPEDLSAPSRSWFDKNKNIIYNDTTGYEISFDLNTTLNSLSWSVENMPFNERFIILDFLENYLNPEATKADEKIFARFPPENPAFPATPSILLDFKSSKNIELNDFNKVYIKDESINSTGTHKDRMALEVLNWFDEKVASDNSQSNPVLSLLTYGCAGMAIQSAMGMSDKLGINSKQRTNLKLLVPHTMDTKIKLALKNIGAQIYTADLTQKELNSQEILELTKNTLPTSYDLTFCERYDGNETIPIKESYYNYMAWEILNSGAKYIFIPFGSGDLYYNVIERLNKWTKVERARDTPPLMLLEPERLKNISLIGCTVSNSKKNRDKASENVKTSFDKLYSPFFGKNNNKEHCKNLINHLNTKFGTKSQLFELGEEELKFTKEANIILKDNSIDAELSGMSSLLTFLTQSKEIGIKPNEKVLVVNTGKLKFEKYL